ncbi:MAG: fibronectin type III domain-containing protein [Fibrobacterota bacterium]|nr:fibronectin type III domain-containing protein [Fibrobacterota bacterium]QQS03620.1 MAG: fibronectin type III domain-containing protein [Fibrobacterota bacterium]
MHSFLRSRLWGVISACVASMSPLVMAQTAKVPAQSIQLSVSNGTARFQGVGLAGASGTPALPKYTLSFLLPPGTDPRTVSVRIDGLKEENLPGSYDVAPIPALSTQGREYWPAHARISKGRDLNVYQKNAFTPANHLGRIRFGRMGAYMVAEVDIHDYLYNPVTGQLRRLVDGTVSIQIASPARTASLAGAAIAGTANRKLADQLRGLVVNFDQAIGAYAQAQAGSAKLAASTTTYTIVTTESILQNSTKLGAFADAKAAAGFEVELVTGSTNYLRNAGTWACRSTGCQGGWGGGQGDAAAEALRSWLKANYVAHNIEYALLVGNPDPDTGSVPMKKMWPRLSETTDRDAPSDYYFAELTGNWDLNGDGFSGQEGVDDGIGGLDKFCEIAVGRVPFYGNFADLDRILAKTVRYMQETDISWRSNVLFSARQMFSPFNNHYVAELLRTDLLAPKGWGVYRVYDSAFGVSPEKTPTTEPNVLDAWKSNPSGYHMWLTHGFSEGASDVFTSASAPMLDDLHPSITFQLSCLTSYPETPANLSYAILKNGGIATVGATRVSWLWADEQLFEGDNGSYGNMGNKFTRYLIQDTLPVGKALSRLRATTDGWLMNMEVFNVYGDPSLVLGDAPIRAASRPTSLTAESGERRIALRWTPSLRASSYTVLRATSASGPFVALPTSVQTSSFEDLDVVNNTRYFYTVFASNPSGQSGNSDTVQATPTAPTNDLRVQYRVGDASATDNQIKPYFAVVNTGSKTESLAGSKIRYWFSNDNASALQVTCDWAQMGCSNLSVSSATAQAPGAGADRYIEVTFRSDAPVLAAGASTGDIQLRVNHTDWTSFNEIGDYSYDANAKSYAVTDKSCLYSATGERIAGMEPGPVSLPATPTGLSATAGSGSVSLKWNASRQATSYDVFRGQTLVAPTLLGSTVDTVFTDRTLQNGTTYLYSVTAKNASGTSARSTEVSATPMGAPGAPSIVSLVAGDSKATVTWTAVANATFYSVKSSAKPGDTVALSITTPATSLEFNGLANGTAYTFVVSASNSYGQSPNSAPMVVTPNGVVLPAAPTNLKAVATDAKVTLSWNSSATATSYVIERADATHPYSQIATSTTLSFSDITVANGTKYLYRVRAKNAGGTGAPSDAVEATPSKSVEPCSPATNMTGGSSGNFNTTASVCKRTTANISGWGCSNFSGRTVKVNGVTVACGAALPAKTSTGYYYFDIGAGAYSWASMYWW